MGGETGQPKHQMPEQRTFARAFLLPRARPGRLAVTRGRFPARAGSIQQGAALVRVHPDTIRRRIASGEIAAYRLGKQIIRIDLDELEALFSTIPTVGRDAS